MSGNVLPKIGIAAFLTLTVFAAGAAATWVLLTPSPPSSLSAPTAASTAPVTRQEYVDKRTVTLDFTPGPITVLSSGVNGRVTSSACSPGTSVASGASVWDVDEKPLLALNTSVPLWRDIASGDKGDDVTALQTELNRLGFSVTADGIAGPLTITAVAKLFKEAGDTSTSFTAVPVSRLIWIPADTVAVASCEASLGDTVSTGSKLATLGASLTKVVVKQMPSDLAPGDRNLTVDTVAVPLRADGTIDDHAVLAQLAATPTYRASTSQNKTADETTDSATAAITGELSLASPIEISIVPPDAVYDISAKDGCVASAGVGYPVVIVGSQLGQTYVRLDPSANLQQVDLTSGSGPACR